ncbi:MAG: nucleotidyltransferase family protein [Clostridiales bacterium]|nr:nucleotidyltransferase family protein [Clostridiales bacterium]
MNNEQLILLKLIRQSQFGPSEAICFDDVNIVALYDEAVQQSVQGLVSPEIPKAFSNRKWYQAQYRRKASYLLYCTAQDELKKVLDDAGIPFVILKGNASAVSYKTPYLRSMGDIDFLVPPDQYKKTQALLFSNGYIAGYDNGRHAQFKKGNQLFEIHHHNSHDIDIEDYLTAGMLKPDIISIDGHTFPILPKLANGLVLLDHFRSHLQSAVGLRHVIDWMMYVYRNLDDEFWFNEFALVAKKLGMDTLAIILTRMCQIYLGLPETITWCKDANKLTCEQLMNIILKSGNFGRKNFKGNNFEVVNIRMKKMGLFQSLQYAGKHNWKAYHKHHWLKPFCWFYQICRYIKQGFKSGRNKEQFKDDFKRSNERYELLKKLGI